MTGTKRKGRPVTREAPAAGKRTQLSVAIPQPLKRQVEQAAKKRGWSISAETAHRLEMSFSQDVMTDSVLRQIRDSLMGFEFGRARGGKGGGLLDVTAAEIEAAKTAKKRSK